MLCIAELYVCLAAVIVFTQSRWILGIFSEAPGNVCPWPLACPTCFPCPGGIFSPESQIPFRGSFIGDGGNLRRFTLWATLIQIPIRVTVTYLLLGALGLQAVAVGTIIGWIRMAVFQYFCCRKWGIHETGA